MTFKDIVNQTVLAMNTPTPSVNEVYDYIRYAYGFHEDMVFLLSQNHIGMLVEGAIWSMNNTWRRDKFEELCGRGP